MLRNGMFRGHSRNFYGRKIRCVTVMVFYKNGPDFRIHKKLTCSYSVETKSLFVLKNHVYLKTLKKELNMPFETLIDDEMLSLIHI